MQRIAHDYWSIWQQFMQHRVMQEDALPPAVIQSWQRCAALGLDPYASLSCEDGTPAPISHELLSLVRPALEDLHQFIEDSACIVVFADAHVHIVDRCGDHTLQPFVPLGSHWDEQQQGSNALALALQESFPTQLDGAMHYRAALHTLYTSAAPVYDLMGRAVGVLAVIGRYDLPHSHALAMIAAAAQSMSNQLQMQVWLSSANDLLTELQVILQTLPEGILLLRHDGVVSHMNAPAGLMLGMTPASVTGRQLREVLPIPSVLQHALASQQPLADEEVVFDTSHGRVACLCSLRPIAHYQPDSGLNDMMSSNTLMLAEPVIPDGFVVILRSIERVQKLVNRMTGARARLTFDRVVGKSAALQEALRLAQLAAKSNATVLLQGETGTGKEIFAQSIHNASPRADGPFVAINCAAIPRELINTELFGYEGGSFTGADRQGRPGKFEQAHGGTLFLDEIGDMPFDLQTTLLRAIETRTIVRIGGQRVINADVRIIVATHKDLRTEAQRGTFRLDLFYRLNVLSIQIPALRERVDDIPLLAHHFLQRHSSALARPFTLTDATLHVMQRYPWPGNVRELENLLERVTYLIVGNTIATHDLPSEFQAERTSQPPELPLSSAPHEAHKDLKALSIDAEIQAIRDALHASNGHIAHAALQLGISRTTLWRKMLKYHL